jgi:hypothetical protein
MQFVVKAQRVVPVSNVYVTVPTTRVEPAAGIPFTVIVPVPAPRFMQFV